MPPIFQCHRSQKIQYLWSITACVIAAYVKVPLYDCRWRQNPRGVVGCYCSGLNISNTISYLRILRVLLVIIPFLGLKVKLRVIAIPAKTESDYDDCFSYLLD